MHELDSVERADLLINLANRFPAGLGRFSRIAEIVDADPERRRLGRERFKAYRDHKFALETHQLSDADIDPRGRYNRAAMDKAFSPADIEPRIYARWEANGYFAPSGRGPPYSIVIPPPNVTGTLHMGHAFQDTIMDALIRYRRMRGFDTLWQPGTDHAGIATQMVVERQLNAAGQSRARSRARGVHRDASGSGRAPPAARSPGSCAGWAPRWTGSATSSPWIPSSPGRSPRPSCACIGTDRSTAANGWSTGIRC